MKIRIKHKQIFIIHPKLTFGFKALACLCVIIVKEEKLMDDDVLVNHERIHFAQQLETLIIGFYLIYFFHALYLLCRGVKKFNDIFHEVCLEREAYRNEEDSFYLHRRELYSFTRKEYFMKLKVLP